MPETESYRAANGAGVSLDGVKIVVTEHSHAAADRAVAMARAGEVEALMKGSLHTDELMSAIVDSANGLRTARRVSHVFVMDVPTYPKPLLITDAAMKTVNPKIQDTLDAAALCKMADRGQITGGTLDGPLAFDNTISAAAARSGADSARNREASAAVMALLAHSRRDKSGPQQPAQ
jgi:phosphate acetyltransferase